MKKLLATLVASTSLVALLGSTPVAAADWVAGTSISLSANPTSIDRGERVRFSGRLQSERRRCIRNQLVILYVDGFPVKAKRTRDNGGFNFRARPAATSDWHVSFGGRRFGVHPNIRTCLASSSPTITISVTP